METHDLTVGYCSRPILQNLNLSLPDSAVTVLIGANGSGKSTLLRTLTGNQPPLAGSVTIDGQPLSHLKPTDLARRLSLVLTDRTGGGGLRVSELVAIGRHPYSGFLGRLSADDHDAVDSALRAVGLAHKAGQFVSALSDGERQKAMIARALAQQTPIIVLDEPTSFLDVSARFEIMEVLARIASDGKSILLSTHDIASALSVATHIWAIAHQSNTVRPLLTTQPNFSAEMDTIYPSARFDPAISDYRAR